APEMHRRDRYRAEVEWLRREERRERAGVTAPRHVEHAPHDAREAEGHHDHRDDRLADERSQYTPLDDEPEQDRHYESERESHDNRQLHTEDGGPGHVGSEQDELAGAEVDHRRRLVDQDEAERHKRVDTADGDASDDQLE